MNRFDARQAMSAGRFTEAARLGVEAEIAFLEAIVQQATAEGTGEDVWYVSWYLVNAYGRSGQVQEAVATAERLLSQPGATPQICTYIAETLYRHIRAPAVALALLQKCYADLESAGTLWQDEYYTVELLSLELAILAAEDPHAERVSESAGEIHWCAISRSRMNDDLLEAIRLLAPLGIIHRGHRPILELMWAQLQRKLKFQRMSKANRLEFEAKVQEVEGIIESLQPPKRTKRRPSEIL